MRKVGAKTILGIMAAITAYVFQTVTTRVLAKIDTNSINIHKIEIQEETLKGSLRSQNDKIDLMHDDIKIIKTYIMK